MSSGWPLRRKGTQAEMKKEPRWNGVPPVGDRPIDDRWKFLGMILLVFILKLIIWGAYRYTTGNVEPFTDRVVGYWTSLFAKPLLQLGPIIILWWFLFKERGFPFRFTRKNLASSIIFGCLGAVLFYVVASVIFVGHIYVMGYGKDFHLVAGWNDLGWPLIIAMMFSYMLSTGPAEELFSRGFLQDQAGRVFSIPFAITFSAVLFAVGHLPISILMHRMTFEEIMWYMGVLVIMGVFFSLIYQWSRNIVLPIIIHGLWDWYLSLFAIRGEYSSGFASDIGANFGRVDFINTVLTLAIMLPIFYLLFKKFWKRDAYSSGAHDEEREGEGRITRWIRDRDEGNWPRKPWITTITIVGIFCLLMYPVAAVTGVDEERYFHDRIEGMGEGIQEIRENMTLFKGGILMEGQLEEVLLDPNGSVITNLTAKLVWEDEPPDRLNLENKPDEFRLALLDENGKVVRSDSGSTGKISLVWRNTDPGDLEPVNYTIEVKLVNAGDQDPIYLPDPLHLRRVTDDSNSYNVKIEYETFRVAETSSDDVKGRW